MHDYCTSRGDDIWEPDVCHNEKLTLYNLVSSSPSVSCSCANRQYLADLVAKVFALVSFVTLRVHGVCGCKIVPSGTIPTGRWFIHLSALRDRRYLGFTTGILSYGRGHVCEFTSRYQRWRKCECNIIARFTLLDFSNLLGSTSPGSSRFLIVSACVLVLLAAAVAETIVDVDGAPDSAGVSSGDLLADIIVETDSSAVSVLASDSTGAGDATFSNALSRSHINICFTNFNLSSFFLIWLWKWFTFNTFLNAWDAIKISIKLHVFRKRSKLIFRAEGRDVT